MKNVYRIEAGNSNDWSRGKFINLTSAADAAEALIEEWESNRWDRISIEVDSYVNGCKVATYLPIDINMNDIGKAEPYVDIVKLNLPKAFDRAYEYAANIKAML